MELLSSQYIEDMPDPNTDPRLLPGFMLGDDNSDMRKCYKIALDIALDHVLNNEQRQVLHMRYWLGMRNSHIARELGISSAAVGKRLRVATGILRKYVGLCVQVYEIMRKHRQDLSNFVD